MRTKAVSLLKELTEAHSVSGHEDEVRAIFVDELEACGELSADKNGSVFCETGEAGPRVLVAGRTRAVSPRLLGNQERARDLRLRAARAGPRHLRQVCPLQPVPLFRYDEPRADKGAGRDPARQEEPRCLSRRSG